MPRTGRGGPRQGLPGKTYTNRSDLNTNRKLPIQVAPSQQYGQGEAQRASQAAVPMAGGPPLPSPTPPTAPPPVPGALGGLDRPTERPDEPVTSGVPIGPGAGPEVLNFQALQDEQDAAVRAQLVAMYQVLPNADLRDLIEAFDAERGFGFGV